MAIELIPRKPVVRPPWQTIFFYVATVFLGLSLVSFFVIAYFSAKTSAQAKLLAQDLSRGKTSEEQRLEKEVLKRQRQILIFENQNRENSCAVPAYRVIRWDAL